MQCEDPDSNKPNLKYCLKIILIEICLKDNKYLFSIHFAKIGFCLRLIEGQYKKQPYNSYAQFLL